MCKRILSVLALAVCLLSVPVSADLIGWWKLDDGSGNTAVDSSGRGQNGTLVNSPTWTSAGVYGSCLQFNGTNQRVDVPGTWTVPQYTVSVWFRQDGGTGSQRDIFSLEGTTLQAHGILMEVGADGRLRFLHRAPYASSGGAAAESLYVPGPAVGTWHHWAVVKTATDMISYVDGVQAGTQANATTFDAPGVRLCFGEIDSRGTFRPWNGAIDDVRLYNTALTAAEVQQVKANIGGRGYATAPKPGDKANDVPREAGLSWKSGEFAATHDVYLGTSSDAVTNATRTKPLGVLASQALDVNNFDPAGRFEFGQTYYWRVDEFNAAPSTTVFTGSVWSFTTEPVSYPVANVTATASSFMANMGPEKAVNGAGLTGDTHSITATEMWLSAKPGPQPTWIQFAFDKVYKLDKVQVWNSNQSTEAMIGFGVKDVVVEYSTDGTTWTSLGQVEIPQAPGDLTYTGSAVDLHNVIAKYVKFSIKSDWGGLLPQFGLSEVRFYYIPVWGRAPQPAPAATGVTPPVTLNWRAGREAASHKVYVGTDPNALTLAGTATTPSFVPANLNLGAKYYWKVEEVNTAQTPSSWSGDVWSFTTADFLVVDNVESYTDKQDAGQAIYQAWADGFDDPTKNGAIVGLTTAVNGTFGSTAIFHGGRQSMPLAYNNSGSVTSEAKRTFDTPQDWTKYGVTTLVLWFRGDPNNTPATLYVKINDTKVVFNNGAPSTAFLLWKQWNINLASVSGVNLKSVKSLTVGIGDGKSSGTGIVYIDDIALYATAPQIVTAADPGTTTLAAYYTLDSDAKDSIGGTSGTLTSIMFANSLTGFNKAAQFNGTTSYIDLGASIGNLMSTLTSATFSVWVNYTGANSGWQRVFDFGNAGVNGGNPQVYMYMSHLGNTNPRFAYTVASNGAEAGVTAPSALTVGWHHLAGVIDASTMRVTLYVDSVAQGSNAVTILPKDLGKTTQNFVGRSQWTADPFLTGMVDELRIYKRALSAGEIRYLAGDR